MQKGKIKEDVQSEVQEVIMDGINATAKEAPSFISGKDVKSLNKHKYSEKKHNFPNNFLIKNKKTGVIVELEAYTSIHACTMIGWRPNNVQVLNQTKK